MEIECTGIDLGDKNRLNPLKTEFILHSIYRIQFVPHRKQVTSPLQSPTG
jgi:hypothetical protein